MRLAWAYEVTCRYPSARAAAEWEPNMDFNWLNKCSCFFMQKQYAKIATKSIAILEKDEVLALC